jgi:tyrosine-protein phosphatase non-receptor type 1
VIAYDHSRVIVHHEDKEIYINASVVKVPQANREYILSQGNETVDSYFISLQFLLAGPLENTVDDFWLMVYQQNSSTVVMLCNCIEMNRDKSCQYWPLEVGHTMVLGESREGMGLEVTMVTSEDRGHFIIRTFTLANTVTGVKRKIKQFHYVDWPDFNVPNNPDQFLEFLLEVRKSGCFLESCGPPVG